MVHMLSELQELRQRGRCRSWSRVSQSLAKAQSHDRPRGFFVRYDDRLPPAAWYTHPDGKTQIPIEDLAFKRNITTIIREIKADGAELLLVPTRLNPDTQSRGYDDEVPEETARNENVLRQLASEFNVDVAPFPPEVISPENWLDSIHVNEAGSLEKASHVAKYLVPIIQRISTIKTAQ